jgi:hypothetical protein
MLLILLCVDKDIEGRAENHCRLSDIALCELNVTSAGIVLRRLAFTLDRSCESGSASCLILQEQIHLGQARC